MEEFEIRPYVNSEIFSYYILWFVYLTHFAVTFLLYIFWLNPMTLNVAQLPVGELWTGVRV